MEQNPQLQKIKQNGMARVYVTDEEMTWNSRKQIKRIEDKQSFRKRIQRNESEDDSDLGGKWKQELRRGGNSNPLQYSCLENSMDAGVWLATVHVVTKSQTQLSIWAPRTEKMQEGFNNNPEQLKNKQR